jgi:hypothetical protein
MDGSSLSLITIPVVAVISLAAWLLAVAYAATTPSGSTARPHRKMPRRHRSQVSASRFPAPRSRAPSASRPKPKLMVTARQAAH